MKIHDVPTLPRWSVFVAGGIFSFDPFQTCSQLYRISNITIHCHSVLNDQKSPLHLLRNPTLHCTASVFTQNHHLRIWATIMLQNNKFLYTDCTFTNSRSMSGLSLFRLSMSRLKPNSGHFGEIKIEKAGSVRQELSDKCRMSQTGVRELWVSSRVCMCASLRRHSAVPLRDKALGVYHRHDIISLGWCLPLVSKDKDALVCSYTPTFHLY